MQKQRAIKLKALSEDIARKFSIKDREFNFNNEDFQVYELMPLSESTALITFIKSSGKQCLAFCYWINMGGGQWRYFFPTYDHCIGMESLKEILQSIELTNFGLNFKEE